MTHPAPDQPQATDPTLPPLYILRCRQTSYSLIGPFESVDAASAWFESADAACTWGEADQAAGGKWYPFKWYPFIFVRLADPHAAPAVHPASTAPGSIDGEGA